MSPRPQTAFVLSGGAALGAIQVGMLRALYERDIGPDMIVGTSVGAVNGALIRRGLEESTTYLDRLRPGKIADPASGLDQTQAKPDCDGMR